MIENQRLVAAALRRLEGIHRATAFDPIDPASRPTPAQQEVIDDFGKVKTQWIVAANQSGKSQTACRLVAWFLTDSHPTWKKPKGWHNEPLLVLVCGRTGKQLEESIWPKIRSFLAPGTFKEIRLGNILQRVEITNGDGEGNRIIFQSLENPNVAAERIQSYVAHLVLIDEMPPTMKVLAEAMVRRNSRDGYFLASFTPLVVNDQIRKMVDAADGTVSKKYVFRMFQNPVYSDPLRQAEIMASMAGLPAHVRATRLFGEWSINDDAVYYFEYDKMVDMPAGYTPLWRHLESVDPALKSALGYTLWAEKPETGVWYCIKAKYITGIYVPTQLVEAVKLESAGVNIIRRVSDPHEVWYIQTAGAMGLNYVGVFKKNDRKDELIKQLQEFLSTRAMFTPMAEDLIAEIQECRWSDKADGKIVNASSFHLLDSAQYAMDNLPKREKVIQASSWDEWLYKANEVRKKAEEKVREKQQRMVVRRRR
jgi:hypothetical protein